MILLLVRLKLIHYYNTVQTPDGHIFLSWDDTLPSWLQGQAATGGAALPTLANRSPNRLPAEASVATGIGRRKDEAWGKPRGCSDEGRFA
jgi:hypothetical protein